QIAELYSEWGHIREAKEIVEKLLNQYPHEEELILFLSEILIDCGEEERAIDLMADIDSAAENGPRALLLLADIYSSQGLDEVAEGKLLEAKRTVPDEPVVTFALAEYYFTLGEYQKSIPHYENLLRDGHDIPG